MVHRQVRYILLLNVFLGLAALVTLYVEATNTPGVIPNVQSAWEIFVETKCSDARQMSQKAYDDCMTTLLSHTMPCNNDEIRKSHNISLEECQRKFMVETTGISTNTTEKHLGELKVGSLGCGFLLFVTLRT